MKQAKRIVAMVLCLLALLALPAGAVMEKGEPNITAQTTMKEVRSNPGPPVLSKQICPQNPCVVISTLPRGQVFRFRTLCPA